MEFLHTINPLYALSGLAVGFLVGMTGVGGGSLMTPLLILVFGIHPATAVGTDLLYAAATKCGGTAVHAFNRTIVWRIVGWLAAGSVPATIATIVILSQVAHHGPAKGGFFSSVLGVALILTAISLMFRKRLLAYVAARRSTMTPRQTVYLTVALGATLGVLVSLSSVGAGAIGVTILLIIYPDLPTVRIVGSDIAHAVPLTLIAGAGHWYLGDVNWTLFESLLVGSLPGIVIGSMIAARIPDKYLRPILASTLAVVGTRLVG
jgi:uncharacterized membrane protein YfcA